MTYPFNVDVAIVSVVCFFGYWSLFGVYISKFACTCVGTHSICCAFVWRGLKQLSLQPSLTKSSQNIHEACTVNKSNWPVTLCSDPLCEVKPFISTSIRFTNHSRRGERKKQRERERDPHHRCLHKLTMLSATLLAVKQMDTSMLAQVVCTEAWLD